MADSSSIESSSTSGSDYSDFEAFIEGEDNERIYEPISEIRPWRFEPPRRTENTGRELEENQEPVRRGRLNQESDEWWVRYVFKYSVWKSVAY